MFKGGCAKLHRGEVEAYRTQAFSSSWVVFRWSFLVEDLGLSSHICKMGAMGPPPAGAEH